MEHLVSPILEKLSVGQHGGLEEDELLLVEPEIGEEPLLLAQENRSLSTEPRMILEELMGEDDQSFRFQVKTSPLQARNWREDHVMDSIIKVSPQRGTWRGPRYG
jgi:hypothetical protein